MGKTSLLTFLLPVLSWFPSHAQTHLQPVSPRAAIEPNRYEISPDAGFMGGSGMLGLRAAMNYHPVTLERGAAQVIGSPATLSPLTLSAVLDRARLSTVVPYGTVGGGLFLTVPNNSVGDEAV